MGIENLLAQGVQIRPEGMERNALMQFQQFQDAKQRNALMQMQMQDVSQQRQLAIQQAQREAAQKKELDSEMMRLQGGGQLDPVRLLQLKVPQAQIEFLANRGNLGRPEVVRTLDRPGANGSPETVQLDKFGGLVGSPIAKPVEMAMQDLGGRVVPVNRFTQTSPLTKTQTPDSVASIASQAAARAQADRHWKATQDNADAPTWDASNQVWVDRKRQTVTPGVGPDGKPLQGKAGAATEDERKAAGWLAQADNAWKNMREVAFDANGNIKSAAKPGFNDALAAIPSFGATAGVANMMRSPDRQKFIQASSSLSEALLRAATGAGVNENEARQKVQELTPVFGEDAETTKQKFDSIPMYLDALKSRGGRAVQAGYVAPKVPTAADNKAPKLNKELLNAADAIILRGK